MTVRGLHDLETPNLNAIDCAQIAGHSYSPLTLPVQNGHVFAAQLIDGDYVKVAGAVPASSSGAPTVQWAIYAP